MSEYGYIPESPAQSFRNNKGIFTANDVYDLTNQDKWTNYGQLELIETQTVSGTPSTVSFDSIKETEYNVHFLTISDFAPQTDNRHLTVQFKVGGVADTDNDYQYAMRRVTGGTGAYFKTGNDSRMYLAYNCANTTNETFNAFMYIYNAGLSSSYTYLTSHSMMIDKDSNQSTNFTCSGYDQLNVVNGIQFQTSGDPLEYGTFSLYGIKRY